MTQVRIDPRCPAVLLKLDPDVFHHGGLGAVRTLGRLGVPVYGVYEDRFAPAAQSRYLRGRWTWRPGVDPQEVCEGLRRVAERIGRPAVLLPTDDAASVFLAEHADALRRWYRLSEPPRDLPRAVADKLELAGLCDGHGLRAVRGVVASSWSAAEAFVGEVGLPVVAKLGRPWLADGASPLHSTKMARTLDDVRALVAEGERVPDGMLLLQELLPPSPDADWAVHGYSDAAGRVRAVFTGVKIRSYPAYAGMTAYGRAEVNPALREQAVELVQALGYRGIFDLDVRRDPRDGSYRLLDFNPRVGAQFRLFVDDTGLDVVRAAYLDLSGQPVPPQAGMRAGRRFIVENFDPLAAAGYLRAGELRLPEWLGSWRGVDEWGWYAADDLGPFAAMLLRMAWRAGQRAVGRGAVVRPPTPARYRPGRRRLR